MKTYAMDAESLSINCTIAKDLVVERLYLEGHISEAVLNDYLENYSIILKPPSTFNSIWSKLTSTPTEERFILVKNMSMVPIGGVQNPPPSKPGCKILQFPKRDGNGDGKDSA